MALTNSEIKFIRSLQLKKTRQEEGLFIVEGIKLIAELKGQSKFKVKHIYTTAKTEESYEIQITPKELDRISGLKKPNTALAVVEIPKIQQHYTADNFVLLLDSVNDPGNLGTIIRTGDWFGIKSIILSNESVDLFNPKVVQSTMGAIFRMNVFYEDLAQSIAILKKNKFNLIGACMEGVDYRTYEKTAKTALLMGSESHGIHKNLLNLIDTAVTIPRIGETESLNLGVATGILISELVH